MKKLLAILLTAALAVLPAVHAQEAQTGASAVTTGAEGAAAEKHASKFGGNKAPGKGKGHKSGHKGKGHKGNKGGKGGKGGKK